MVFHNLMPDAATTQYALQSTRQFFNQPLRAGSYVGVFRLDQRLVVLQPFTDDRAALLRAAQDGFAAAPTEFARVAEAVPDAGPIAVTPGEASSPAHDEQRGGIVGSAARGTAGESGARQHITQLSAMVAQLAALPGRKTVVLFSPGMINSEDPNLLEGVISRANDAQITFYAIQLSGADALGGDDGSIARIAAISAKQGRTNQSLGDMAQSSRQMDQVSDAVRSRVLRALPDQTGGDLFPPSDLEKSFQRVLEDVDAHYEVVYRSGSQKLDGSWRPIELKASRPGVRVQSRSGYFAVPARGSAAPAAFESAALRALTAEPRPHSFDFRSTALRFRTEDAGSQCAVAFEVPAASLTGTPDPDRKTHRFHLSLLALVKDAGGQVIEKIGQEFPVEIPNERLAAARADTLTHTRPIKLAPGRYTLETAAVDREGKRASTNVLQMEVPARPKGVGMSNVLLVRRVEPAGTQANNAEPLVFQDQRVIPLLATDLDVNAKPYVYFVVYPDTSNAEKPRIQVEFLVGGQSLAKQMADLPPADASGAIPMVVAAATRPGECELRVTALQGSDSATESVRYRVK
jgi:VWFA-related protein